MRKMFCLEALILPSNIYPSFVNFPTTAAGYLSYEYAFNILGLKQLDQLETNLKNMFIEKGKGNDL